MTIGTPPARRRSRETKLQQARLRAARANQHWTEIEDDLVARGQLLVSASSDRCFKVHPGAIWEPGSSAMIANMAPLHWYAPDDGEPVFVELLAEKLDRNLRAAAAPQAGVMSRPLLIRLCRIATSRELLDPELARDEMYDTGAFRLYAPGDDPFAPHVPPLLVDHGRGRQGQPIGRVLELFADDDPAGGRWHFVRAEVDDAPSWLQTNTACSFAHSVLRKQKMPGWDLVRDALLTEVSVLSPGVEPADQRARVWWLGPKTGTPNATPPPNSNSATTSRCFSSDPASARCSDGADVAQPDTTFLS